MASATPAAPVRDLSDDDLIPITPLPFFVERAAWRFRETLTSGHRPAATGAREQRLTQQQTLRGSCSAPAAVADPAEGGSRVHSGSKPQSSSRYSVPTDSDVSSEEDNETLHITPVRNGQQPRRLSSGNGFSVEGFEAWSEEKDRTAAVAFVRDVAVVHESTGGQQRHRGEAVPEQASPSPASPMHYSGLLRLTDYRRRQRAAAFQEAHAPRPPKPADAGTPSGGAKSGEKMEKEPLPSPETRATADLLLQFRALHVDFEEKLKAQQDEQEWELEALRHQRRTAMQNLSGEVRLALNTERQAKDQLITSAREILGPSFPLVPHMGAPSAEALQHELDVDALLSMLSSANPVWIRFKGDKEVKEVTLRADRVSIYLQKLREHVEQMQLQQAQDLLDNHPLEATVLRSTSQVKAARKALQDREAEHRRRQQEEQQRLQQEQQQRDREAKAQKQAAEDQEKQAKARAAAEKQRQQLLEKRGGDYQSLALQRIQALQPPADLTKRVLESKDPGIKRSRMNFRKLFSGAFNKVGNDPDQIKQAVDDIFDKGHKELQQAVADGWGPDATTFYIYSVAEQIVKRATSDQFNASDYEQAFQISCVTVDLCMLIGPQLWTQLIAMIQRDCPMLVPTVVQDSSGMSDDQWKAATGFRADDTVSVDTHVEIKCA
eukprot:TRINITY_DN2273_c0_g1_i2.p1 TRINITY_DN2273_c0_g1~~TRINITY_DN2273_c0_g1_i2.p1  ORF type:complete len:663 (-),score=143.01 TRINITY_DN2273_c0_g1_i2:1398-3386(-)